MVPVSGAVKDRGHDIHGPDNMHGDCENRDKVASVFAAFLPE